MRVHDVTAGDWPSGRPGEWRAWLRRHPRLSFLLLLPQAVATAMAVPRARAAGHAP